MRIMFCFAGGNGHFQPMAPIALAAQAAGHDICFVGEPSMMRTVTAAGFIGFAAGVDIGGSGERLPLLEPDAEREARSVTEGFARKLARVRAADLLPRCHEWLPDVMVCDEFDFGAMVVAERLKLPYASVVIAAEGSFVRPELVAEPLAELRAEYGLPVDPDLTMLTRHLHLVPAPASYRNPGVALPETARLLRPLTADRGQHTMPPWRPGLPDAPTVYFTLGTVFDTESGDLFARGLAGLRALPVNVVVTVGHHIDPAEFGPQPDHVHIERYIPQALVLPHCDAVVSQGGSGAVIAALAHGLPQVLLPIGADQPQNARRCEELGVARVLDVIRATPEEIRVAVADVLADPGYRRRAVRIRDEIAAMPGPERALSLLEQLVNAGVS
jgi:UDP:flavonoid glycosyltransferase YjiC (YdhE family)